MAAYQIVDEPRPSGLQKFVVNPIFPIFAFMFAGPYISWAWSLFNAKAIGSPTIKKEIVAILIGLSLVILNLTWLTYFRIEFKGLPDKPSGFELDLLYFSRIMVCLPICYYIYFRQSASFEIFKYFGGESKNVIWVLPLCFIFGPNIDMRISELLKSIL